MAELEEGWKWWLRYIIVPVIAGSGLIGIVVTLLVKQNSADSERAISSQLSVAAVQSAKEKQDNAIASLRAKGPPFAYRLAEGCPFLWTNYNGKRISVKDPKGLADTDSIVEPLGALIEEDASHFYSAGSVIEIASAENPPVPLENCYPPVDGLCGATPLTTFVGKPVTFAAAGFGGTGMYAYNWSGDDGFEFNDRSFTTSFAHRGLKSATVKITSNGQSVFRTCKILVK